MSTFKNLKASDITSYFDNIKNSNLSPHIDIKPPYSIDQSSGVKDHAPIVFSMNRRRSVPVDWSELVPADYVSEYDALDHLRVYLESSWQSASFTNLDANEHTFLKSSLPQDYYPIFQRDITDPHSNFSPVPQDALLFVLPDNQVRWDDTTVSKSELKLRNGRVFYPTINGNPLTEPLPEDKDDLISVIKQITKIYPVNPLRYQARYRRIGLPPDIVFVRQPDDWYGGQIRMPDESYWEAIRSGEQYIDYHPDLYLRKILSLPTPETFLDSWGISSEVTSPLKVIHAEPNQFYFGMASEAANDKNLDKPAIVVKHGKLEEYYYLQLIHESVIDEALEKLRGRKGLDGYHTAWRELFKAAHRVYLVGETKQNQTEIKYLDMQPQQIQREFLRIKDRRDTLRILHSKYKAVIENKEVDMTPEFRQVVEEFADISKELNKLELYIKKIVDRAKDLGYILIVDDRHEVTLKNSKGEDTKHTLNCGHMYVAFENYVAITQIVNHRLTDDPIPVVKRPKQPNQAVLEGFSLGGIGRVINSIGDSFGSVIGSAIGGALGPLVGSGLVGSILGGILGRRRPPRNAPTYKRRRVIKYTDYELMNFHEAPHLVQYGKLVSEGKEVHLFQLSDEGYVSERGASIESILVNLDLFPDRRANTVFLLPHYDGLLSDEKSLSGYYVIFGPQSGREIVAPPSIFFEEKLSYRMEWLGVELGELLHSINLAPGESRTITINRSYERRSETIDEIISESQISTDYSQEFSSSFEQTLSKEVNTEKKSNWSADASVSYGGFGGGASGGGSSSKSVRDFSETVNRNAQKAASKVTTNNRQKVSSKNTNAITISRDESSVSTLENINQGRSLNALFYSLYNIYNAHLYLDELKLVVDSGQELIAGTGITAQRFFSLEELDEVLLRFFSEQYWFKHLGVLPVECALVVVQQILTYLKNEYSIGSANADGDAGDEESLFNYPFQASSNSEERFEKLETELITLIKSESVSPPNPQTEGKHKTDLQRVLSSNTEELDLYVELYMEFVTTWKRTKGSLTSGRLLRLPSGAIHQDSFLGVNRATEPYSDRMREAEYLHRIEEVSNLAAHTDKVDAIAESIRRGHRKQLAKYPLAEPRIKTSAATDNLVEIVLTAPLPEGHWLLEAPKGTGMVSSIHTSKTNFSVLLNEVSSTTEKMRLIDEFTGVYISEQ